MRWAVFGALVLLALWMRSYMVHQDKEIAELRADMERIDEYLPNLIRSELRLHERRMIQHLEELARK